jgi:hypothetical protein
MIMGNGVIIIIIVPSQEFEHPSRWFFPEHEVKNHEFPTFTSGTKSIKNLMKIRPDILTFLNAHRRI